MSVIIGPYRLSDEFFQKRKLRNRCDGGRCNGDCCAEGVFLTRYDARRIVAVGDALQPYLAEPYDFAQWDFTRSSFMETPVLHRNTSHEQCWFLMRNRHCAVHKYALDRGIPVQDLKPYFCRLFPLSLVDIEINVMELTIDPKAFNTCLVEADEETWVYELLESDLRAAIGDEWYEELKRRTTDSPARGQWKSSSR